MIHSPTAASSKAEPRSAARSRKQNFLLRRIRPSLLPRPDVVEFLRHHAGRSPTRHRTLHPRRLRSQRSGFRLAAADSMPLLDLPAAQIGNASTPSSISISPRNQLALRSTLLAIGDRTTFSSIPPAPSLMIPFPITEKKPSPPTRVRRAYLRPHAAPHQPSPRPILPRPPPVLHQHQRHPGQNSPTSSMASDAPTSFPAPLANIAPSLPKL